jgi:hypothetical protein
MALGTRLHCATLEPQEFDSPLHRAARRRAPAGLGGRRQARGVHHRRAAGREYGTKADADAACLPWGWAGCEQTYRTQAEAREALGRAYPGEWVTAEERADAMARAAVGREALMRYSSTSSRATSTTKCRCTAASKASRLAAALTS